MKRRILKPLLGLIVAGIFSFMFLRQIELGRLMSAIASVNTGWLVGAFALLLLGYAARVARWRQMLAIENPTISCRQCAGPFMAGFALNNVLPFRLGDVARAFGFSQQLRVSPTLTLSTLVVERLLDLMLILLLLGVAIEVSGIGVSRLLGVSALVLILMASGTLLLLLFPRLLTGLMHLGVRLLVRWLPRVGARVAPEVEQIERLLGKLAKRNTAVGLLLWSVLAWGAEGGVYWCLAKGLSALAVTEASWLALPVGTLATLIPSTPGYVGTFDYFTMQAMHLSGNDIMTSAAYALLVHLILWLPVTLIGGAYLLMSPMKKLVLSKEVKID